MNSDNNRRDLAILKIRLRKCRKELREAMQGFKDQQDYAFDDFHDAERESISKENLDHHESMTLHSLRISWRWIQELRSQQSHIKMEIAKVEREREKAQRHTEILRTVDLSSQTPN